MAHTPDVITTACNAAADRLKAAADRLKAVAVQGAAADDSEIDEAGHAAQDDITEALRLLAMVLDAARKRRAFRAAVAEIRAAVEPR